MVTQRLSSPHAASVPRRHRGPHSATAEEPPHADAAGHPAGPGLPDRACALRRPDRAGSPVPRPPPAAGARLANPGPAGLRLLLLPVVLPAAALDRDARPVPT